MYTILYCHNLSQISGGETSLLELFRNLDRKRFQAVLAAPDNGPFSSEARALGVKVFPVEFGRLRRLDQCLLSVLRLCKIAKRAKVDVLHGNSSVTNIPAAIAAHLLRLPVVWHARTLLTPGEIDLDRYLAPLASLIISNSAAIADRFQFRGKLLRKSLTIINGVDTERFNPSVSGELVRRNFGFAPDDIVVGVVGRISPIKGHRTFLEAAAKLQGYRQRLRFLVVGGGIHPGEKEYEEQLRGFAEECGLKETVIFTGYQKDVRSHTAALDIAVIPSDAEACGRVIFEAMAMSKPVVGTNTGGTPEIIVDGDTGILIPPRDPEALTEAVLRLADDPRLRDRMGKNGRRRIEKNFSIEAHVKQIELAYSGLLDATS